jgi:hypothetical protein
MLEPQNDRKFIRLISDLGNEPSLPDAWTPSTDADVFRRFALEALNRLNSSDSRKFLTVLSADAPPNEAPTALLSRASKDAKDLLPHLLRKYRELCEAEARETAHDKFMKHESEYDPFVEGTNFTRDSYSGRGEVEPEKPLHLDHFGNCVRD